MKERQGWLEKADQLGASELFDRPHEPLSDKDVETSRCY